MISACPCTSVLRFDRGGRGSGRRLLREAERLEQSLDRRTAAAAARACAALGRHLVGADRSEEHTSELPSLMRISDAVLCLKINITNTHNTRASYMMLTLHKDQ